MAEPNAAKSGPWLINTTPLPQEPRYVGVNPLSRQTLQCHRFPFECTIMPVLHPIDKDLPTSISLDLPLFPRSSLIRLMSRKAEVPYSELFSRVDELVSTIQRHEAGEQDVGHGTPPQVNLENMVRKCSVT
ncbi:unnamed protein product [Boreogadus saida]